MDAELIQGGLHSDARGSLRFCNDFDMSAVKRFYTIANSAEQPVRGWIGHRRETKWFFPLKGTTEIVVEPMDLVANGKSNGRDSFLLDSDNPCVLKVGPGSWFYIEQHEGSEVMVFSNCKVGEFADDDFRREF
jgi:dTDP-4-dehydrorhamnose 3,5-epimerase